MSFGSSHADPGAGGTSFFATGSKRNFLEDPITGLSDLFGGNQISKTAKTWQHNLTTEMSSRNQLDQLHETAQRNHQELRRGVQTDLPSEIQAHAAATRMATHQLRNETFERNKKITENLRDIAIAIDLLPKTMQNEIAGIVRYINILNAHVNDQSQHITTSNERSLMILEHLNEINDYLKHVAQEHISTQQHLSNIEARLQQVLAAVQPR